MVLVPQLVRFVMLWAHPIHRGLRCQTDGHHLVLGKELASVRQLFARIAQRSVTRVAKQRGLGFFAVGTPLLRSLLN